MFQDTLLNVFSDGFVLVELWLLREVADGRVRVLPSEVLKIIVNVSQKCGLPARWSDQLICAGVKRGDPLKFPSRWEDLAQVAHLEMNCRVCAVDRAGEGDSIPNVSMPVSHMSIRSNPRPKLPCGVSEAPEVEVPIDAMSMPRTTISSINTSSRSLAGTQRISPTRGTSRSVAATVRLSSLRRM